MKYVYLERCSGVPRGLRTQHAALGWAVPAAFTGTLTLTHTHTERLLSFVFCFSSYFYFRWNFSSFCFRFFFVYFIFFFETAVKVTGTVFGGFELCILHKRK